ncbi:hypothetical protein [Rathayibacter sp. VKM Ac-2927]|uniref:hypothetical protein n=1 Tax=Rathayibacter sp. VKM Ac-2927 TaxID=2929478 RepID=UPI001FB1B2A4|nr:hypothetical protein [Rathayibacter sp. VKM Ac-2927]MCJ1688472.1 hypothetical protein [Rathayibacter sp. VKM Ac-2927]
MSDVNSGATRRQVVKGAAWAMPVVAVAVATPSVAASTGRTITFSPSEYVNPSGLGYIALTGSVSASSTGAYPALLLLTYSDGFAGPNSVPVAEDGTFVVSGVTCPSAVRTGTVLASADGYTSGAASISVTNPQPRSGSINFNPVQYRGTRSSDLVLFPAITGTVAVTGGPLPDTVILSFSTPSPNRVDLRRDEGPTVPIDPITGKFTVTGVYNAIVGGDNPFGFMYAGVDHPDITYGLATAELDG